MENDLPDGFRKKVYTKLSVSELSSKLSESIAHARSPSLRKITASEVTPSVRSKFKEIFLPLLIDIFELRQTTENYKNQLFSEELIHKAVLKQPPEEILQNLQSIQAQVLEAKNWCDSVLLQLSKATDEAKSLVTQMGKEKKTFIESIIGLFQASKGKKDEHTHK